MFKKVIAWAVLASIPFILGCSWSKNNNEIYIPYSVSGSSDSGSSGSGSSPAGCTKASSVRVGFFGFDGSCPNPPANNAGILPVGCTGSATATPKLANGEDQPDALHAGVTAKWSVFDNTGYATVIDSSDTSFNKLFHGIAATPTGRPVRVEVDVCGVVGSFSFEVR